MEKLRIAVVGRTRAGKSTFINRLVGGDICHVGTVIDTTDKIHKFDVTAENGTTGLYFFDTPGLGSQETFEAWTRAYLGLVRGRDQEPVESVPICRIHREHECPHAVHERLSVEALTKKTPEQLRDAMKGKRFCEAITLPRAFVQARSPLGKTMPSCQEQRCCHFMPLPVGNAELLEERPDLILYLVRASMGGFSARHDALKELAKAYEGCVLPILTCIDEVRPAEVAEVISKSTAKSGMGFRRVSARTGVGMDVLRGELAKRLRHSAKNVFDRNLDSIEKVFGKVPGSVGHRDYYSKPAVTASKAPRTGGPRVRRPSQQHTPVSVGSDPAGGYCAKCGNFIAQRTKRAWCSRCRNPVDVLSQRSG